MQHRLLTKGVALAAGLLLAAAAVTPAAAGPLSPNRDRYAALGDSYAAGLGVSASEAYPALLAGRVNKVTALAESGATTVQVLAEQVPMVPSTARQITLTVGGNDVGFGDIAIACASGPAACAAALQQERPLAAQLPTNLTMLIQSLKQRAPMATVYVTGYPVLFEVGMSGCATLPPELWGYAAAFDQATRDLNDAVGYIAAANGATFVDVEDGFGGQGLCNPSSTLLYPPMPEPSSPTGFSPVPLHPTAAGQAVYAAAIEAAGFDD